MMSIYTIQCNVLTLDSSFLELLLATLHGEVLSLIQTVLQVLDW